MARSGGEKGLKESGAGTLGVPLEGTRRVGGLFVGNLISGSSAFSKTSLNIWKFTVHVLLKPGLENFRLAGLSSALAFPLDLGGTLGNFPGCL